jgi:hypothetical protein
MLSRFQFFFGTLFSILFISFSDLNAGSIEPYIGIHGGINFSKPIVIGSQQQIVTLLDGSELTKRNYNGFFKNLGYQIGFSFYLKFNKHLSLGILPEIANYTYGYSSTMKFFDNQGDTALSVDNVSKSKINYFNIPIILQYQLNFQKTYPYVFFGGSYGLMRNAQHYVNLRSIQQNNIEFNETTTDNYSTEFIRSKLNILAGIGVMHDFKLFHLALDISYWFGLNNIINESARYNTNSIGGTTYDIPDDIKLNNLVINASLIFPINKSNTKGSLDCVVQKRKR